MQRKTQTARATTPPFVLGVDLPTQVTLGVADCITQHLPTHALRLASMREAPEVAGDAWGVIASPAGRRHSARLLSVTRRIISVTGVRKVQGVATVTVDDEQVAAAALTHFRTAGCRALACVWSRGERYARHRRAAFRRLARGMGLPFRETELNPGTKEASLIQWLQDLPRGTGLLGASDALARRCLLLLHALRAVPGEVAVLGVGDSERLCQTVRPSLSSVIVPWRQIGHRAAEELIRQQETPGTSGWITLPPRGVAARASTRATPVLDPLVQRALVLISEQAPLGATVSDLLAALHVSRRTLETRFRQALGHTPLQELHTQRVARARRLLLHTDDKIESIARRSGFRGRDRFTKVFRRFTGLSPGEFRREQG